jgi:hypothetical protein
VQEVTVTGELKHKDGVMMRIEYRRDFTVDPFFVRDGSNDVKVQNVITLAWTYAFSSKTH